MISYNINQSFVGLKNDLIILEKNTAQTTLTILNLTNNKVLC